MTRSIAAGGPPSRGESKLSGLILALDTTTPHGSAALLEDGQLRAEIGLVSASSHSARLLRSIDDILGACGLSIKDVEGFAVAAGPGSFTGIRIGLATVKALAFASGKPVAPVSTLLALAWKLEHPQVRLACPLLDAKKGEVYAALFEFTDTGLEEIIPQGVYAPEAFLARLPGQRITTFIGSGAGIYRDRIMDYLRDKARFSKRSSFIAYEVGRLGAESLARGQGIAAGEVEPLYFRKSQAEEKNRPGKD